MDDVLVFLVGAIVVDCDVMQVLLERWWVVSGNEEVVVVEYMLYLKGLAGTVRRRSIFGDRPDS